MRRSKYIRPNLAAEAGKTRLTTSAMIASIAGADQKTRAAPFGHALAALANKDDRIVGLSADLAKYTDLHIFAQAHPDRFFQMGMAEQLLMGAAGGLAKEGFVPFATTYAVFGTRRAKPESVKSVAGASSSIRFETCPASAMIVCSLT